MNLGLDAGAYGQGINAIALGSNAGNSNQGLAAVAVGQGAGYENQGTTSIAIGINTGLSNQAPSSIAIGQAAALNNQNQNSIAIGYYAGANNQSTNAIAIGYYAGFSNMGSNSIAIGKFSAPPTPASIPSNTIALSGGSYPIDKYPFSTALYVNPVRIEAVNGTALPRVDNAAAQSTFHTVMLWNSTSSEMYGTTSLSFTKYGATGPVGPQMLVGAHIIPTSDLAYDLGATGIRFRDLHLGGDSIYLGNSVKLSATGNTLNVTAGGVTSQLAGTNTSGTFYDTVARTRYNGPLFSLGATGATGPLIVQTASGPGAGPQHVLEIFNDDSGENNWSYAQTVSKTGSYNITTVYSAANLPADYSANPRLAMNSMRGTVNAPQGLAHGEVVGAALFYEGADDNLSNLRGAVTTIKIGGPTSTESSLNITANFDQPAMLSLRSTGPTTGGGAPTGPVGPTIITNAPIIPLSNATYDLGATGIQFKDVHFSGSIYNNGSVFQGGVSGLTYRATGPTGPLGQATGPAPNPTLQVGAYLVPTTDNTYDLGATGIRFKDEFLSGSLYMGATGAIGVNILQTGRIPSHILEDTTTGPTLNYSQTLTKPGLYNTTAIYGSLPPAQNQVTYAARVILNSARGYSTGPTSLTNGDILGAVLFNENNSLRAYVASIKSGATETEDVSLLLGTTTGGGNAAITINSTGPTGPTGQATGPVGKNIGLNAHMYPMDDATYNLGATGYQFKDVHFSGTIYNNGTAFQGGVSGLTYRATGPTGPLGQATGPAPNPTLQVGAYIVPTTDATYDLGATGIQFKDVHFSGSLYNSGRAIQEGPTGLVYRATGPTGPLGQATGPTGPTLQMTANLVPTTTATYDLGATGIQFKDVHFSGSLYNSGRAIQEGPTGLVYRATGPTGPLGQATGPTGPTLQMTANLVPTTTAIYDLGATGIQFKDVHFSGSLYNNGTPFTGGGGITAPTDNFMVAGGGTGAVLAYSYDAATFTSVTQTNLLGCYSVAWNGSLWVAGGPPMSANFRGAISGTTLTVTTLVFGVISVGMTLVGVDPINLNGITITALGTGTGGVGTYTISQASASFTATITDDITLTVTAVASGTIVPSMLISGQDVTPGTRIVSAGNGTGGTGTYFINISQSRTSRAMTAAPSISASFTATISGTELNVSAIASGSIIEEMTISGDGVTAGTIITGLVSGLGGTGTYTINISQTVATGQAMIGRAAISATSTANNTIMYSSDGINWNASTQTVLTLCNALAWNGSLWVAGGLSVSSDVIAYSYDGINWIPSLEPATIADMSECYALAWNGYVWVAGGTGSATLIYSVDGINWILSTSGTNIFPGDISSSVTDRCNTVAWNGTMWVAGGSVGEASFDAYISSTTLTVTGVTYGKLAVGRVIVSTAVGFQSGTTISSQLTGEPGGIGTYTVSLSQTVGAPESAQGMTIASIGGGIAYSYDGINWIIASSVAIANNLETCNIVAWNGSIWLAGGIKKGGGQTILRSADGITWTAVTQTQITTAVFSLAWNGTTWIAGGTSAGAGKLAKSTDGSTWTAVTYSSFATAAYALSSRRPLPFVGSGGSTPGLYYRASGPTGPTGGVTGPAGPWLGLSANIVPLADNVYDLGATGLRFRDLHVGGSTIYLGDSVAISASAGTLNVNSTPLTSSTTVPNSGPGGIGNSEGFAQLNSQLSTAMSNTNPGNIAMSADGKYVSYIKNSGLSPSRIYVSTDFGSTFTEKGEENGQYYKYVAVSSTGLYQAAVVNSGGVFFSSDSGSTWANVGLSGVTWAGIKISTDGKIVFAYSSSAYYITKDMIPTDTGIDWVGPNNFSNTATNIYMSDSGDRILHLYVENSQYYVKGYKVTRNGVSTAISASGTTISSFTYTFLPSVALSRDGTRIGIYGPDYAAMYYYMKTNQYTWILTGNGTITLELELSVIREVMSQWSYFPTVMSSDGTIQVIGTGANDAKGLYISYNSGVAWTYMGGSSGDLYDNWYYTLMSSDGVYINIINDLSQLWQCYATSPTVLVTDLSYTPTTPLDWPNALQPISVGDALDTIAKYLKAYQTGSSWTDLT